MKRAFSVLFFLMITSVVYCQHAISKEDYLKKSKRQKTAAWICLGGGAAITATGFIIAGQTKTDDVGTRIAAYVGAGAGILSSIASIPLFIASNRNSKKAAALSFKINTSEIPLNGNMIIKTYPAISFAVNL